MIRQRPAGDDGEGLALADPVTGVHGDRLDDPFEARHHMHGAVLVEADFADQLEGSGDPGRPGGGDLNAIALELGTGHGYPGLDLLETEGVKLATQPNGEVGRDEWGSSTTPLP